MYTSVKKQNVETINRRIDITDYTRTFLMILSENERKRIKINRPSEAERIKDLMNIPKNTFFKSFTDLEGYPYWQEQKVDYIASNLLHRNAYIFYFICSACDKRVKFLYEYMSTRPPVCRECCYISYGRNIPKKHGSWWLSKKHLKELRSIDWT